MFSNRHHGDVLHSEWLLRTGHLLRAGGLLHSARMLYLDDLLPDSGLLRPAAVEGKLSESVMMMQLSTDTIWSHLSSDLRRFIRRRVPDDHVVDDLLQETFLRVHRKIGTLQDVERMAAWVYRIARNVVHDHHRKAGNAAISLGDSDPVEDDTEYLPASGYGRCEWLGEMIRSLPDGYREAVQLAEIEALAQQEVANRLGLSLSGAKSRIQRGRAMLRGILERCCHFELDGRGNVMDAIPRPEQTVCQHCQ